MIPHLDEWSDGWKLLEYLASCSATDPVRSVRLTLELIRHGRIHVKTNDDQVQAILTAAKESGSKDAYADMRRIVNLLGERGNYDFHGYAG